MQGTHKPLIIILKYKGKLLNLERGKQAGGSFMLDWNELKPKIQEKDIGEIFLTGQHHS